MIDNNKIKSAAQGYCDATYGTLNTNPFIAEAFRKGANWAINEFLKDLWHPVWKEPDDDRYILWEEKYSGVKSTMFYNATEYNTFCDESWDSKVASLNITRWLYIDDLFSKEGGNHG